MPRVQAPIGADTVEVRATIGTIAFKETQTTGVGIVREENDPENIKLRLPKGAEHTNRVGELVATKLLADRTLSSEKLTVELDSLHTVKDLTINVSENELRGYLGVPNEDLVRATVASLRYLRHEPVIVWKGDRSPNQRDEAASALADEGALQQDTVEINTEIANGWTLSGANLSCLTQATAYKLVRRHKSKGYAERRQTTVNLKRIEAMAQEKGEANLKATQIWGSIRSKDITRSIRNFLWLVIHDGYMVGDNWLKPGFNAEYQERSKCRQCGQGTETMTHIIEKCSASGQAQVWNLARELWGMRTNKPWPNATLEEIILSTRPTRREKPKGKMLDNAEGEARLLRILMTESAYLIWKIRCDAVIKHEGQQQATGIEIHNKWLKTINSRLELDSILTRPKYGKKALKKKVVLNTWRGTLRDEGNLPRDWTGRYGVLVGIEPRSKDGRRRGR
ncbi:hypothetical protein JR316_0011906 [Psilocybe cubensis]|uniref:Uncharacterized protein n=2 Tax=Psilocybe cubensis TaxID=181762 RepID=A0ACB8GKX2_PSICU|nr:hypothetical protein JR316_0011906 [Psilocybe cubensis]KAH9476331.1 hypothetical protein JR316_0011906 [Psilocybe cubensis]